MRLQRIGGYDGSLTLSHGPLPQGVTDATFSSTSLPSDGLGRTLTLTFADDPPDGTRELVIRAEGGGDLADQTTLSLRFDATPPVIGAPWPSVVLRRGTLTDRAPVRLAWDAHDGQGPVALQEVQRAIGDRAFRLLARPGRDASRLHTSIERRTRTAWRIRARDAAGNATVSSPLATKLALVQSDATTRSAGWNRRTRRSASREDLIVTSRAGAAATLSFTGRAVAVVAPVANDLGRFRVRIDGRLAATVDQASGSKGARRIVFASDALTPGRHVIKLVAARGTVELDALLVLK
jgi:hypothetical protein